MYLKHFVSKVMVILIKGNMNTQLDPYFPSDKKLLCYFPSDKNYCVSFALTHIHPDHFSMSFTGTVEIIA